MKLRVDDVEIQKIICLHCDERQTNLRNLEFSARKSDIEFEYYITGRGDIYEKYDAIDFNFDKMVIMRNGEICKENTYPKQRQWPIFGSKRRTMTVAIHHRNILRRCIEEDLDNVLLIEDDVVFSRDIREILENVKRPKDWNVLILGGIAKSPVEYRNRYPTKFYNFQKFKLLKIKKSAGFFGVLLSRQGIRKALEHSTKNKRQEHYPVDDCLNHMSQQYFLVPPVIFEAPVPSQISIEDNQIPNRGMYWQASKEGRIWNIEKHDDY